MLEEDFDRLVKTLPPAFDKEKNDFYVNLYHNGDESARDKLIEGNLRLVVAVVNKHYFAIPSYLKTELYSFGVEALVYAVEKFNPDKDTNLSTYIYKAVEQFIFTHYARNKKHNIDTIPFSSAGPKENENDHLFFDPANNFAEAIPDKDDFVSNSQNDMLYHQFIDDLDYVVKKSKIPEKQIQIFYEYTGLAGGEKSSLRILAKKYNYSPERIRVIVERIRKKFAKFLEKKYKIKVYSETQEKQ